MVRHKALWLACSVALVLLSQLCPSAAQQQVKRTNCSPVHSEILGSPFPGSEIDSLVLNGFHQMVLGNVEEDNLTGMFQLCKSYFRREVTGTYGRHVETTLLHIERSMRDGVLPPLVDVLPRIPAAMPACTAYFKDMLSAVNATQVSSRTGRSWAAVNALLQSVLKIWGGVNPGSSCEEALQSEAIGTDAIAANLQRLHAQFSLALAWANTLRYFIAFMHLTSEQVHILQSAWDTLPSMASNWSFVSPAALGHELDAGHPDNKQPDNKQPDNKQPESDTDSEHPSIEGGAPMPPQLKLYESMSDSFCASLAWLQVAFCSGDQGGLVPVSTASCSILPDSQSHTSVSSALVYADTLTNATPNSPEFIFNNFLRLAVSQTNVQLRQCPVSNSTTANPQAAAALSDRTRCLNLNCTYPLVTASKPALYDNDALVHTAELMRLFGYTTIANISSIRTCGRSCLNVFSAEGSLVSGGALICTYIVILFVMLAYGYALILIIHNWRTIFDTLHWRALIYVNSSLMVDFVLNRLMTFQFTRSSCFDNNVAIINIPWRLVPWQCRASSAGSEMMNIIFPLLMFWQSFIWFSYIRRVTSLRLSAAANQRWNLQMRAGETLVLLAVCLVVIVPMSLRSYDSLIVNGAPLGLPCELLGSPYQHAPFIGLGLHCASLTLLAISFFFFVKSSVVKRKIWKIPVIGTSWMRTTGSMRSRNAKTLDPDTVMRQTQQRIVLFMIFVVLYQAGLHLSKVVSGTLVTAEQQLKVGMEFADKQNCVLFSCHPEQCVTAYSFHSLVETYYLPQLVFRTLFGALTTCLLSFLSYPGFESPFEPVFKRCRPFSGKLKRVFTTVSQLYSVNSEQQGSDATSGSASVSVCSPVKGVPEVIAQSKLAAVQEGLQVNEVCSKRDSTITSMPMSPQSVSRISMSTSAHAGVVGSSVSYSAHDSVPGSMCKLSPFPVEKNMALAALDPDRPQLPPHTQGEGRRENGRRHSMPASKPSEWDNDVPQPTGMMHRVSTHAVAFGQHISSIVTPSPRKWSHRDSSSNMLDPDATYAESDHDIFQNGLCSTPVPLPEPGSNVLPSSCSG